MSDTMKEVYILAQSNCGLKVGDYVKVTRKAEDYEAGWNNIWSKAKDYCVGKVYKIIGIDEFGIWINPKNKEDYVYAFPYFVLEKVEKPARQFKPFDKVLVRDGNDEIWKPQIFSMYVDDGIHIFYTLAEDSYAQCIPYEGNEHLVGTKYMPKGYENE